MRKNDKSLFGLHPGQFDFDNRYRYNPYDKNWRWGGYFGYRPEEDDFSARGQDLEHPLRFRESYEGRGPKGYQRPDQRLYEDVCERLKEHPGIDASHVEVNVKDAVVVLTGRVSSRLTKRLIENVAEDVKGVRDVHNYIGVEERGEVRERTRPLF